MKNRKIIESSVGTLFIQSIVLKCLSMLPSVLGPNDTAFMALIRTEYVWDIKIVQFPGW